MLDDGPSKQIPYQAKQVAVIPPVRILRLGTAQTEPRRLCVLVQPSDFQCACFAALANRKPVVRRTLNWLIQSSLVVSTPSNASIPSHDLGGPILSWRTKQLLVVGRPSWYSCKTFNSMGDEETRLVATVPANARAC
jgi:hypothetical protein